MADEAAIDGFRRLHPASLVFSLGTAARRLIVPGLVLFFFSRGGSYEFWLMLFFFPAAVGALATYLSFRYRFGGEDLVVRQGIFTRNERHIPYGRIQNIDLRQNLFARWLGVAEVRLETASGEKPEAVMRVLSLTAVETMRDHVFHRSGRAELAAGSDSGVDEAVRDRVLHRLDLRQLVLLGLLSNRGMAVIAAGLGLFWSRLDLFVDEDRIEQWLTRLSLPEEIASPGPFVTVLLALLGLSVFFVLVKLLSVVWAVIRFHGFTLQVRGDDLRASYGLFTRISATVPRKRIQLLSLRRGFLHRRWGCVSVQVETAGQSGGEEGAGNERLWLAPLIDESALPALLEAALPDVPLDRATWQPIAGRAWRRVVKKGIAFASVVTLVGVAAFGPWAAVILVPGFVLAWFHARLYVRYSGYAILDDAVAYRSGWWLRRVSVVRFAKIQVLSLRQSPFDRWNRMASVAVDTAGAGRVGHRVEIHYLDAPVAAATLGQLAEETSLRDFRW